jgi:hypothetical protein
VALDTVVRRAPRFGRVIGTGAFGGALLGFTLGLVLPNSTEVARTMVGLVVALGFALVGGTIAGLIAVKLDGPDPGPPTWIPEPQDPTTKDAA